MDALELIRARVAWCEAQGVAMLCCPEAILGGLADDARDPLTFALANTDRLASVLAPLASDTVTTIVGFTELAEGRLYNTAAILWRGAIVGVYRKMHPAINRSVYEAGRDAPVFRIGGLTFGVIICNDSNFAEPANTMAARGATVLFVPTNNGLPPAKASADLVTAARNVDIARAVEKNMWIIRADVAGQTNELVSYGSSGIVDPQGTVVRSARALSEDLLVVDLIRRDESRDAC
jgi:predicted amidohydrolase